MDTKEYQTYRDSLGKPSEAIKAMIEGLRKYETYRNFEIDMETYGKDELGLCVGCAATCATQFINNIDLKPDNIEGHWARARAFERIPKDQDEFEGAMENTRRGSFYKLFEYFNLNPELAHPYTLKVLPMFTENWKSEIKQYEQISRQMKFDGY